MKRVSKEWQRFYVTAAHKLLKRLSGPYVVEIREFLEASGLVLSKEELDSRVDCQEAEALLKGDGK